LCIPFHKTPHSPRHPQPHPPSVGTGVESHPLCNTTQRISADCITRLSPFDIRLGVRLLLQAPGREEREKGREKEEVKNKASAIRHLIILIRKATGPYRSPSRQL